MTISPVIPASELASTLRRAKALFGVGCGVLGAVAFASAKEPFGQPDSELFRMAGSRLRDELGMRLPTFDAKPPLTMDETREAFDRVIAELEAPCPSS